MASTLLATAKAHTGMLAVMKGATVRKSCDNYCEEHCPNSAEYVSHIITNMSLYILLPRIPNSIQNKFSIHVFSNLFCQRLWNCCCIEFTPLSSWGNGMSPIFVRTLFVTSEFAQCAVKTIVLQHCGRNPPDVQKKGPHQEPTSGKRRKHPTSGNPHQGHPD